MSMEKLTTEACLDLLRAGSVGRLAFVVDEFPVTFPVNYRVAEIPQIAPWIMVRTRPGNTIDHAPLRVAFEIDGIDAEHRQGWSVLVRGTIHHVDDVDVLGLRDHFDPEPWLGDDRTTWLFVKPLFITGRRLVAADMEWAVDWRPES